MSENFDVESCIKRTETITEELSNDNLTFEESLKLYKEGLDLLKKARKQLDEYQKEIEVIDLEGEN